MSTNRTSNYNLNQWVKSDRVLMEEFNADNAKIDAAVKAVDNRVDSLSSTVAGKASASSLSALQNTVNSHTTALAGKGNCQIHVTSYTGSGGHGVDRPNSLTFPATPEIVFVGRRGNWLIFLRGETYTYGLGNSGSNGAATVTWNGNTLQWYSGNADVQMNSSSATYSVIALIKVS